MRLTVFVVIFCAVLHSGLAHKSEQHTLNGVGDFMLKTIKNLNVDGMPMNDFKRSYAGGMTVLEAKRGTLADLNTLHRKGDIKIDLKDGNSLVVNVLVAFGELRLRFGQYNVVTFGRVAKTGTVEMIARRNLFEMEVDIGDKPTCFVTINKVDVLELDEITIKFYKPNGEEDSFQTSMAKIGVPFAMIKNTLKSEMQNILREDLLTLFMPNEQTLSSIGCVQAYTKTVTCEGKFSYGDCVTNAL